MVAYKEKRSGGEIDRSLKVKRRWTEGEREMDRCEEAENKEKRGEVVDEQMD